MAKNNIIKFRVDRMQLEKIKSTASEKGHTSLASYLRDLTLNQDILLNRILFKLHSLECSINTLKEDIKNGKTQP